MTKLNRIYAMELVRSFQIGELSRRDFLLKATAVFGSAAVATTLLAACQPLQNAPPVVKEESGGEGEGSGMAAASAAGLITGMANYRDRDGGDLMGYMARPEGDEPAPAVIVLQSGGG